MLVHLTNVSLQKYSDGYNSNHGGKFPLSSLKVYLELNYGYDNTKRLFKLIDQIYLSALKAVQPAICHDPHCFELYGFDVLIDEELRPWLLEVNASPSLVSTTPSDKRLKKKLIADLCDVVMPANWLYEQGVGAALCSKTRVGEFVMLYDESKDPLAKSRQRARSGSKRP